MLGANGYAFARRRAAIVAPAEPVDPDWDAWLWLRPDRDATISSGVFEQIEEQVNGWRFIQSTPADRPDAVNEVVGESRRVMGFDGTDQYIELSTTDVPLASQRIHDGTGDVEILVPFYVPAGAPTGRRILATGQTTYADTGIFISHISGNTFDCLLFNGATRLARCLMTGEIVPDQWQLLRLVIDTSTDELSAKIDAGGVVSQSVSGSYDTGNAGTITIGSDVGGTGTLECKVGEVHISKTIAEAERVAEQEAYFAAAYGITALEP